jgi:hypothetical protein
VTGLENSFLVPTIGRRGHAILLIFRYFFIKWIQILYRLIPVVPYAYRKWTDVDNRSATFNRTHTGRILVTRWIKQRAKLFQHSQYFVHHWIHKNTSGCFFCVVIISHDINKSFLYEIHNGLKTVTCYCYTDSVKRTIRVKSKKSVLYDPRIILSWSCNIRPHLVLNENERSYTLRIPFFWGMTLSQKKNISRRFKGSSMPSPSRVSKCSIGRNSVSLRRSVTSHQKHGTLSYAAAKTSKLEQVCLHSPTGLDGMPAQLSLYLTPNTCHGHLSVAVV